LDQQLRLAIRHAFASNGWVQNTGVAFLVAIITVVIAALSGTMTVKAAATTIAAVGTLFLWIAWWAVIRYSPRPETEFSGLLEPANDPTPPLPRNCKKESPNAIGIFYGNSVAFTSQNQIAIVQIAGEQLLRVERTSGGLSINAQIFSEDGRIVATIENNEFSINPNNYFRRVRPDRSTLLVYDQHNLQVLNIRYLNSNWIQVLGVFRLANHMPVTIREDVTIIGESGMSGACSNDSQAVIVIP
jgi:hypothetical protein